MVEIEAEIKGLEELQRKQEQVIKDLTGDPMMRAMAKATLVVQAAAKKKAPVDTGRLRSSITPDVVVRDKVVQGIIGSNVKYAPFQERRKRFLRGAIEEKAEAVFRILGNVVAEIVDK